LIKIDDGCRFLRRLPDNPYAHAVPSLRAATVLRFTIMCMWQTRCFAERNAAARAMMHDLEATPTRSRSNCLMFATLRMDFFCVTIAPYENPN